MFWSVVTAPPAVVTGVTLTQFHAPEKVPVLAVLFIPMLNATSGSVVLIAVPAVVVPLMVVIVPAVAITTPMVG